MPRKLRELRADLRRAGYFIERQSGSHETWIHEEFPDFTIQLAGKDGADARPYQEQQARRAIERLHPREKRKP